MGEFVKTEVSSQPKGTFQSDRDWFVRNWTAHTWFGWVAVSLFALILILSTWGIASWVYNKKIDRLQKAAYTNGLTPEEQALSNRLDSLAGVYKNVDKEKETEVLRQQHKLDSIQLENFKKKLNATTDEDK